MAKGVLIAAMDFSNVAEDEFNDWYDTGHIPERQRVPGFLVCQRWIGAENPRQSVATYDLENVLVLQGPDYRAIGGENLSPWSKRVTARVQRLVRFEGDQILPGDRVAPDNAGGLLVVGMTPAPAVETAFNAWYDTEHVPALARVPGVLCAAASAPPAATRDTWPSTISPPPRWSTAPNGRPRAARRRCPSTSGRKSATACASSAEITDARAERAPTSP